MIRVYAVALNTFREAVRDRVFTSILFFAGAFILLSLALQEVTIGDQDKVVRSVGQGSIDVFGSIVAMFLGVSIVWKELDKRTIYTILSKPLPRWQFILGKYAGLLVTVAAELAILGVVYAALLTTQQSFPPAVFFVSMGTLFFELMLLTAWATLFSASSSPTTATAFTLSVFVIGHLADDIWLYGSQVESPAAQAVARGLYWALPNFELFSIRSQAVHELPIPWEQVAGSVGYGLAYSAAVLCMAMFVFQRRDVR
ncbi:MAG: ABC transporter permease [Myxococcota bacterium]|nr:ABC transporter permease [Myxococcota bacterium]